MPSPSSRARTARGCPTMPSRGGTSAVVAKGKWAGSSVRSISAAVRGWTDEVDMVPGCAECGVRSDAAGTWPASGLSLQAESTAPLCPPQRLGRFFGSSLPVAGAAAISPTPFEQATDHAPPGLLDPIVAERRDAVILPTTQLELAAHPGRPLAVARVDDDGTHRRQGRQDFRQFPARAGILGISL